jgi:hypothetical protein
VNYQIKDVTEEMPSLLTNGSTIITSPMKPVLSIKLEDMIMVSDVLLISNAEIAYQEKDAGLKKMLKSMVSMNLEESQENKP